MAPAGWTAYALTLALLLSCSFAQEYHRCNNGVTQEFCVDAEPLDGSCTTVHVILSADGTAIVDEEVPLAGAIGGGTITVGCVASHGLCSTCLEIKSVAYDAEEQQLSYEPRAVTNCAGLRTTIPLGTATVDDCILGCEDECNGHGDCVDNQCVCSPNFHGESCALEIANSCFQYTSGDAQSPFLCSVTEVDVCFFIFSIEDEEGVSFGTTTVDVDDLSSADTEASQVCYPLGADCEACTQVVNFEKSGVSVSYQMELALDCGSGSLTYPLVVEQLDISPSCADGCDYSTSDPETISGYTHSLTIPVPAWYYTYLVVDRPREQPLADLKLYLTVVSGEVAVFEKLSCKPYPDDYDFMFGPDGDGEHIITVMDECDNAHTNHPNGESLLYYFGFHCTTAPCAFSYEIVAHVIVLLTPSVPSSSLYVPQGTDYYYFDFVPRDGSPVNVNILIDRHPGSDVHASVYLKAGDCADKDGDYSQFTNTENEELSDERTIVYTIAFDPTGHVGEIIGVTAYLEADCASVVCTLLSAEILYAGQALPSPSTTASPSPSASPSPIPSPSRTPSVSRSRTPTRSPTATPTATPSSSEEHTDNYQTSDLDSDSYMTSGIDSDSYLTTGIDSDSYLSSGIDSDSYITSGIDSDSYASSGGDSDSYATSGGDSISYATTGGDSVSYLTSGGESDSYVTSEAGSLSVDSSVATTIRSSSALAPETEADLWLYVMVAVAGVCGLAVLLALLALAVVVVAKRRQKKSFLYVKGVDSDGLRLDDGDFEL